MRFISTLLIGLIAMSSASAEQSLSSGSNRVPQNWNKPTGSSIIPQGQTLVPPALPRSCPKGTIGKWPYCITVRVPKCPENSIGKWPNCRAIARNCPKGTIGKWPDCIEVAKPVDKPCPAGHVRKGKKCVELTKDDSGAAKPPPALKSETQEMIPPAIAALTASRPHRPREILVLVNAARADEIAARLARQYDVTADPRVPLPLLDGVIVRLRLTGNRSLESLLASLSTDPDVQLAQPNYDYRVSKDTMLPQTVPQYAGEKIRLDEAHRLARGKGVMIAVIDTAIEGTHPELIGAIAGMFDAIGAGPSKPEPHGTEIAGILVAHSKLKSVAPEAKLLSVRAFSGGRANPAQSTTLQLLKGINWAFASGARVMNMSFAGPMDPLLERIIKAAAEKGVIFIAAAGNNGPKAARVYPAAYPEVIAVTATDEKDKLYGKANRGDYIFIAAPGVDIIVPALKDRYELSSGTSMAAAHVSGVVALLLEHDGKLSASQVREILSSTARNPDRSLSKDAVGAGIVDAASALGAQRATATTEVPLLPAASE
jgi:subtilisin family serine protease